MNEFIYFSRLNCNYSISFSNQ